MGGYFQTLGTGVFFNLRCYILEVMSESISPRLVGLLAILALVPHAIYASVTGMFTTVMLVIGVVNILLITVMLVLAFGSAPGDNGHGAAAAH